MIADFRRVDRPIGQGVDLLKDSQAVSNAFKVENEILFSFPKVLGEVIGPFYRGDFVSFSGSYKNGKTWWLNYTAIRALLMGHRVVFFSLEMTEDPVIRRFWQSLSGKPLQPTKVKIPYFIESAIRGMWDIEYREEDKLIDIVWRAEEPLRIGIDELPNINVPTGQGKSVALSQLVATETVFEDGVRWRRNRFPAISIREALTERAKASGALPS